MRELSIIVPETRTELCTKDSDCVATVELMLWLSTNRTNAKVLRDSGLASTFVAHGSDGEDADLTMYTDNLETSLRDETGWSELVLRDWCQRQGWHCPRDLQVLGTNSRHVAKANA